MPKQKVEKPVTVKSPKTIKVSTLVIIAVAVIALVASFAGGWYAHQADTDRVNATAAQLIQRLK